MTFTPCCMHPDGILLMVLFETGTWLFGSCRLSTPSHAPGMTLQTCHSTAMLTQT